MFLFLNNIQYQWFPNLIGVSSLLLHEAILSLSLLPFSVCDNIEREILKQQLLFPLNKHTGKGSDLFVYAVTVSS